MTWNLAWVLSLVQAFMPTSRSKFWTNKIPGFWGLNSQPIFMKLWCGTIFRGYEPKFYIFLLDKDQTKFFWGFSCKKSCLRLCKNFVLNPAQNFWNFSLSTKSQKWTDLMTWNLAWVLSLVQAFMPTSRSKFWTNKIPGFWGLNSQPIFMKLWCGTIFRGYEPKFYIFLLDKDQAKFIWGFSCKISCLRMCKNFVRNLAQIFWNFSLSAKSQKWTALMTWNLAWVFPFVQAFMPTRISKF